MWFWVVAIFVISIGAVAFIGAPYVPSKRSELRKVFTELYPLSRRDVLVDIGSGDGVVLREASSRGACAIGYEIHPLLVLLSRCLSRHDGHVSVQLANFWRTPLPDDVTVVYAFGDGRDIDKMYARIEAEATRIGRPITFISYAFEIKGVEIVKTVGAHHLYLIKPLQA